MPPKKKTKRGAHEPENLDPDVVLKEVRRCRDLLARQPPRDLSKVDLSGMRIVHGPRGKKHHGDVSRQRILDKRRVETERSRLVQE